MSLNLHSIEFTTGAGACTRCGAERKHLGKTIAAMAEQVGECLKRVKTYDGCRAQVTLNAVPIKGFADGSEIRYSDAEIDRIMKFTDLSPAYLPIEFCDFAEAERRRVLHDPKPYERLAALLARVKIGGPWEAFGLKLTARSAESADFRHHKPHALLEVALTVPNRNNPSERIPISASSIVGVLANDRDMLEIIRTRVRYLIMHELDEWIMFDGERVFDPHK